MTEQNIPETPAGDWFNQWLSTGTVAQRSIDVYGRPDLLATYETLERRYQLAVAEEEAGAERAVGETGPETILEEMQRVHEEWQASKTTWYIRALNDEEQSEILSSLNDVPKLAKDATDEQKDERNRTLARIGAENDIRTVAAALVKIENQAGDVVKTSITEDEVRALAQKLGSAQISRLAGAAVVATRADAAVPVPSSRTNSKSDRG